MVRWLLVLILCASSRVAGAQKVEPDRYRSVVSEAISAQESGDPERAHALFAEAHSLQPSARTLRGLGVTAFLAGRYVDALTWLEAALTSPDKPLEGELGASVEVLVARAKAEVTTYALAIEPSTATLWLGDETAPRPATSALRLMPGTYRLRVTADGYAPVTMDLVATRGVVERIRVVLVSEARSDAATGSATVTPIDIVPERKVADRPDAPPMSRRRRAAWGLAAASLATGATGLALWLAGRARVDRIDAACGPEGCTDAERDTALDAAKITTFERGATAGLVLSGACAALGFGIWLWDRSAPEGSLRRVAWEAPFRLRF